MARCQRVGQVWNILSSKVQQRSSPSRKLDVSVLYMVYNVRLQVLFGCEEPTKGLQRSLRGAPWEILYVSARFLTIPHVITLPTQYVSHSVRFSDVIVLVLSWLVLFLLLLVGVHGWLNTLSICLALGSVPWLVVSAWVFRNRHGRTVSWTRWHFRSDQFHVLGVRSQQRAYKDFREGLLERFCMSRRVLYAIRITRVTSIPCFMFVVLFLM